jgi:hypothetical protein
MATNTSRHNNFLLLDQIDPAVASISASKVSAQAFFRLPVLLLVTIDFI